MSALRAGKRCATDALTIGTLTGLIVSFASSALDGRTLMGKPIRDNCDECGALVIAWRLHWRARDGGVVALCAKCAGLEGVTLQ